MTEKFSQRLKKISVQELINHGILEPADNFNPDTQRGFCCAFCGSGHGDNHTGAGELDADNMFYCYACHNVDNGGHKLSAIDLFMKARNINDFSEACKEMANEFGTNDLSTFTTTKTKKKKKQDAELLKTITEDIKRSQIYLAELPTNQRRGLTLETMTHFKFGYLKDWTHPNQRQQGYTGKKYLPHRRIIIPTSDTHYNAVMLSCDREESNKDFWKMHTEGIELFNASALSDSDIVIVVEGEIDTASIWQASNGKIAVVGAIGGNGNCLFEALKKQGIRDKKFLILFDNDAGQDNARKLLKRLIDAGYPAVSKIYDSAMTDDDRQSFTATKIDANSILQLKGNEFLNALTEKIIDDAREELAAVEIDIADLANSPAPMNNDNNEAKDDFIWTQDLIKSCPVNLRLPSDYTFSQNGISLIVETKKGVKYVPVTKTPTVPTKIFREPKQSKYTYEIAILIRGVWRTVEIDGRTLADPRAILTLADTGALILEPKILCRFLTDIISLNHNLKEIKAYASTGWIDDSFKTFAYIGNDDCIIRRAGFDFDRTLATRGNGAEWLKKFIEVTDRGGAITHAYIGTALASILARPFNIINPQAHLQGTSGSAKTALQKFTASIFGNPRELMKNFAATNKYRQLTAAAFCDLPTFHDELETVQSKSAEETLSNDVYNFADGKGNQANKRDGTARETFRFGGARLTTGERPILKQNDLRGAYKRLLQFSIQDKLFDDEFATELHIFSESNFGHYALQWIQYAQEHMQDIQAKYQQFAKSDPTTRNYEPTHLKMLAAGLVAFEFFKVATGINDKFDTLELVRDRRYLIDYQLPTLDQIDDAGRAIKELNSYVAAHEKSFTRDEKDNDTGKIVEISAWGTACFGKIFDTGEVAFHPTELKRILEDELHYASADKLINEWNAQGNVLITAKGRTTHLIRIGNKTYRTIHFRANIISTDIDSAEENYYDEILKDN